MAVSKKHFLSEMIRTGIIGEVWPKVGYVIVIIKDDDGSVIFVARYDSSDHEGHAEMKMLSDQDFLDKVKTGGVDIIVTSNYSPCWECASELKVFYNDKKRLIEKITIQFSRVYRLNEEKNKVGLENLNKAGIKLGAMTEKSWFDVIVRFMFGLEPDKVRIRDRETRKQLEGLLRDVPKSYLVLLSMVEKKQDVLSKMLSPGLVWPNDKYLMITVRRWDGRIMVNKCYGNSDHEHAVMTMLKDPDAVKVGPPYTVPSYLRNKIILTFNYSPCPTCAAHLIKLYRDNKGLIQKFTIQFSCLFSKSETNEIITTNKDALQKLNGAGITLEAMTEKSWFDLVMLFMFGLEPNKVRNRDKNTQETLEKLLEADLNVEGLAEDIKAWSI